MRNVLTSWKEIAQYVGKGVRSVQRWEKEFGFPVRRPLNESHHAVLAIPAEIDAWVQRETSIRQSELEQLRDEVERLRGEVGRLQAELITHHKRTGSKAA